MVVVELGRANPVRSPTSRHGRPCVTEFGAVADASQPCRRGCRPIPDDPGAASAPGASNRRDTEQDETAGVNSTGA
ncbi:hypothetical protein G419_15948 [Rhodococcus triatomae BKS 15-14]|nr:hypothetical protein G419_15948 [Rhodococcus triatomae BKS 15-14]